MKMTITEFMEARGQAYFSWPKLRLKLGDKNIDSIELSHGGRYDVSCFVNKWVRWGRVDRLSLNGDTVISVDSGRG